MWISYITASEIKKADTNMYLLDWNILIISFINVCSISTSSFFFCLFNFYSHIVTYIKYYAKTFLYFFQNLFSHYFSLLLSIANRFILIFSFHFKKHYLSKSDLHLNKKLYTSISSHTKVTLSRVLDIIVYNWFCKLP